ncbi:hypothetical protein PI124_g9348 [Phytophthora idaei]|nr:hypothetical protein PI126_g19488 [Phytophthora idaei]KAG3245903.1 hypothetical protein PI124_g9348 [Phytophthora idaei]
MTNDDGSLSSSTMNHSGATESWKTLRVGMACNRRLKLRCERMADIEVGVRCDRTGCRLTVNSRDRTGTPHVDRTLQDLNPEGRLRSVPTDPTCGPNEVSKQSVANLPPSEQAVAKFPSE